jgi:hypothetical protein
MAASKPLTRLLVVSKQACDAMSKMICAFYGHLNSGEGDSLMTMKKDKSVFTVADGIVQHLLQVLARRVTPGVTAVTACAGCAS